MATNFQFKYLTAPTGELSGQSMVQQTEDAINAIGAIASQSETDSESAMAIANQALTKADNAQSVANNLSVQMEALSASVQTIQETVDANTEATANAVSLAQASANSAQVSELSAKSALANSTSAQLAADLSAASAEASETSASEAQVSAAESAEAAAQAQAKAEEAQSNAETAQAAATTAADAASGSAGSAATSATSASDSADLSKAWAVSTESPDSEADADSDTGLTQSSRTWALASKTSATSAQTSADSASESASSAQTYADNATRSATTATTAATTATTKASEAEASATAAAQALEDADVSTVLRYTEQSLTDDQKTQALANVGAASTTDLASYLPLSGGTMTGAITQSQTLLADKDGDSSFIEIRSATSTSTGARLRMDSTGSDNPGEFWLDTGGTVYRLKGAPSGTLSWNGKTFKVGDSSDGRISRTVNTSYVALDGGSGWEQGASLLCYGKASSSTAGAFLLSAHTDSAETRLWGRPDGTLTWAGTFTANGYIYVNPVSSSSAEGGQIELMHGTNSSYGVCLDTTGGSFRVFGNGGSVGSTFVMNPQTGYLTAPVIQATSDIRKKSDLKEVSPDLSSIKTYSYVLKDDGKRHVGLVAQEVEKVIPTAVTEDDEGMKSLDYNSVVAALVAEVNALKKRVEELEEA